MSEFLKKHPFAVDAYFDHSIVLTYAVKKEFLQSLIPECLQLDTFNNEWGFVAVAMVKTRQLRPAGFPKVFGNEFFLVGYRIFVNYYNVNGKRLRGLYILKSETDRKKMEWLGNIFTGYRYTTTDITESTTKERSTISSIKSRIDVIVEYPEVGVDLPVTSLFADWKQARRFSGPLPFTFSFNNNTKEVLIVQGLRENWQPTPVKVVRDEIGFLQELKLNDLQLASAFIIRDIPYHWKKGTTELWKGLRRPMQGVSNVVRFNWHFYVCSFLLIVGLTAVAFRLNNTISWYLFAFGMVITLQIITSLIVSYYVYDLSGFYTFKWLRFPEIKPGMSVLNIHAGFDETSPTLRERFSGIHLKVLDFYDPVKHTEVSIKRARKMYPPASGTQSVTTSAISLPTQSADIIFVTFAAHEIRDKLERVLFFTELRRLLKKGGTVIVTEHLRDVANLFAFNIGFIHFYSRNNWSTIFDEAGFTTVFEQKTTPFESTFFLSVNVS